ncbi:MAG: hypothetical protein ACLPT6_12160 [Desulfobaccales bacterium]|jgi:hypothetical protein
MQETPTQSCDVKHVLDAKSRTAAETSPVLDCLGYEDALLILNVGAITATGTIDCKVQESPTGAPGSFTDVPGAAFSQIQAGGGSQDYVGGLLLKNRQRFLQVILTPATAASVAGVNMILYYAKERPIKPSATLEFAV